MFMVTFTEAGKISSRFIVGTSILILTSGIKILQLMFLSF
jgi:hypothetical protein